jgi:hypothetical protein
MHPTRALTAIALCLTAVTAAVVGLTSHGDGRSRQSLNWVAGKTDGRFVVHEWGTFTSFSGADSVKLEFRPLVDADLPPFVLDRGRQAGIPNPFGKINLRVLQRMETPITYFYTDRERQASVRVGFPQGLLTEFFPPVKHLQPEFKWGTPEPLTGSELDWGNVWIVPEGCLQANVADAQLAAALQARIRERLLPASNGHDHYRYARETDSALVYVERPADEQRPATPSGGFFEKFLFYRGVGNFELPLKLTAQAEGRFELSNVGEDSIRSLFLVTVEGEQLRFVKLDRIRAAERLLLVQTELVSSADQLAEEVVASLIEEQLYEKEARAMINTWRTSWFEEQGTRLFYMLPRTITNELLPLEIQPLPDEMVRVMVGRLEIMRPEDEARVSALIKQSMHDRAAVKRRRSEDPNSESYALPAAIVDLGRLAEPALVRVKNMMDDADIRREASLLLEGLRQYRDGLAPTSTPLAKGG